MLESRVTIENGNIIAWIDRDETPWIEQPFYPSGNGPEEWDSEEAAKAWADNWIVEFNNRPEPTPLA